MDETNESIDNFDVAKSDITTVDNSKSIASAKIEKKVAFKGSV